MLEQHRPVVNFIHASAALSLAAKMDRRRSSAAEWESMVALVVALVHDKTPDMGAREAANSLWSLAMLRWWMG